VPPGTQVPPPPAPVNPGATFPPSGSQIPPAPAPISPSPSRYAPEQKTQDRWEPAPGTVKLLPPEPLKSESAKVPEPKASDPKERPAKTAPPLPPVGIPQFNPFKDGVATGLRPSLDDGLDWLQANGYHTVLHVRKPGEDDSSDRKQVEKRQMTYLTVAVAPENLTKKTVDEFSHIVADKIAYPLFVYDRDGSLAGGLWYLHFRTAEQSTDDVARVRAGALGFREDRDDAHRSMWLAVQNYLKSP